MLAGNAVKRDSSAEPVGMPVKYHANMLVMMLRASVNIPASINRPAAPPTSQRIIVYRADTSIPYT